MGKSREGCGLGKGAERLAAPELGREPWEVSEATGHTEVARLAGAEGRGPRIS